LGASSGETFEDPTLATLLSLFDFFLNSFNNDLVVHVLELSETVSNSLSSRGLGFSSGSEDVTSRDVFPLEIIGESTRVF
jgi:hypothetical protein